MAATRLDVCDALSKHFAGTAPTVPAFHILRIILDSRYVPVKTGMVRSRLTAFLKAHRAMSGATLRCLRVNMACTRDCNTDWDKTEVRFAVNLPKGRDTKDACLAVVADFHNLSSPFAGSSRSAYAFADVALLMQSCFISLVFAPLHRGKGDAVLMYASRWRGRMEGGEEELQRQWECQVSALVLVLAWLMLHRPAVRVTSCAVIPMGSMADWTCMTAR